MLLNAKCHFMRLGNNAENETFLFKINNMENRNEQKIIRIIIDNKLNFKKQINESCKKGSQKLEHYLDCQAM